MRIASVDVAVVSAPFPQPLRFAEQPLTTNTAVVVHVQEAGGAVGFGYAPTFGFGTQALQSHVADDFAPQIMQAELGSTDEAIAQMNAAAAISGRLAGTGRLAVAMLEMALLDIEAQVRELPLHRFWGQATESVRAYASGGWRYLQVDQLIGFVRRAIDDGFDTVKLQVGLSPAEDAARLQQVREAVGPAVGLMLDANQQIPAERAHEWMSALAPFDPVWLEEPVTADNHVLLTQLREAAPFPIAAGESETEAGQLDDLLARGALDVIQPDAYRVGLNGTRQIRDRADAEHIGVAPHMAHEISAHVLSGTSQHGWLEHFDWFDDWWEAPVIPAAGRIAPSVIPGHGLKLRAGWLQAHRL